MTILSILSVALTALAAVSASEGYYGCEGDCVGTYDKCAGNGVDGVLDCCSDADHCVQKTMFFSQCRPVSKDIPKDWDGTILTCPDKVPPAPTACVGDCVGTFDKCAGKGIGGLKSCCNSDDHCVMKNRFFSACRPRDRPVPDGWAGVVVDCTTCGPSSAEVGEFIDDDCDVMFIDSLTLDDCDTECATGGFPACDRPADADPNDEASCYGYVEVSPGSCSMRSMEDEFWLSWLTCREGGVPIPAGGGGGYGDGGAQEDAEVAAEIDEPTIAAAPTAVGVASAEVAAEDDGADAEDDSGDDVAATGRVGEDDEA